MPSIAPERGISALPMPAASSREPRFPKLRRNLALSTSEAGAYGAMVGMGETYLPAFALALGMGEVTAGIIASAPMLVGGVLQSISPWAITRLGSYKTWIVFSAALQGASLIPLVVAACCGSISPAALLVVASLYWAGGLAAGPAWNTWIGHLVPTSVRSRFFAQRTRVSQLLTVSGFLAGGALLQWATGDWILFAFAAIFGVACLCRLVSAVLLIAHQESATSRDLVMRIAASQVGPYRPSPRGIRLITYLVVVQGMVQISGPYFTPYMLKQLHFDYASYVALVATAFIAKAVSLALWGNVASRRGPRFLLWLGGIAIVPLASLWTLGQSFAWVMCVQILSGTFWAAYELGFFLMFFEAMPVPQRARMLTMYNLANTCAWCAGSLIGAAVLSAMGPSLTSYWTLFALSSCGRLAALSLLFRVDAIPLPRRPLQLAWRTWGLRPTEQPMSTPVLATLDAPLGDVAAANASPVSHPALIEATSSTPANVAPVAVVPHEPTTSVHGLAPIIDPQAAA